MQTAIQTSMRLFSHIEGALKKAAQDQQPISVRDLYQNPDVHAVAKNEQHVRDLIKSFANKKLALRLPITEATGDNRARIGYMWNDAISENDTAEAKNSITKSRATKLSAEAAEQHKPVIVAPPVQLDVAKPHEIELVFGEVSVVIGRNEKTGAVRVSFQFD